MTRRHAAADSATRRLRQALRHSARLDWPAAHAAILAGAPIDTAMGQVWFGATPLIAATSSGCTTEAGWLLNHGADTNARNRNGWTALMTVNLRFGAESAKDLIATLLDHGADPSQKAPDGRTLPEIFVSTHRKDMLPILDRALAGPQRAEARQRLLTQLTIEQRTAWLPKSSAVETAMTTRTVWRRLP